MRMQARLSDVVTTSSPLIKRDLEALGISPSSIVVFAGPAPQVQGPRLQRGTQILWLGSPSTFANIAPLVDRLHRDCPRWHLRIVGAPFDSTQGADGPTFQRWTPDVQREALAMARIGLMPLVRGKWEDRKAAYKVLEYLAEGIVPVVEDVPALHALLNQDELDLCVRVISQDWTAAVQQAWVLPTNDSWIERRNRLFDRLSRQRYSRLVLGKS
ncbi:glycosyltransferase [Nocardioides sp. KIGAM211]|uniref:Glycosyltransferase n=1 Tax=Nocardioides luti TaxID=2761101 RepID=A0A7X0VCR5_9ACTN|nr:glycosyltransferase [Nocardioides luti]MBB6628513.1 glycosyltransferase [Nocardioides luti]